MRKKFMCCALCVSLLALCGSAWADVTINSENFPDENFRDYVAKVVFKKNVNDTVSDEEIAAITKLDLTVVHTEIKSLEGIEHFTALTTLNCSQKSLTVLDLSKNVSLDTIYCNNNALTTLTLGDNTNLTYLECSYNKLETLDLSGNTALTNVACQNNRLMSLDITMNTELIHLYCNNNRLSKLDISKNSNLKFLHIQNNRFTTFDATVQPELPTIRCEAQEVSINALSEDEYGYQLAFSALSLNRDLFTNFVEDTEAFDSSGNAIEVEDRADAEIFYFEVRPALFKYKYNVGYDKLMDVTVKFGEYNDDDDDDGKVVGSSGGGGGGCDSGFGFMGLIFVSAIAFRKRK